MAPFCTAKIWNIFIILESCFGEVCTRLCFTEVFSFFEYKTSYFCIPTKLIPGLVARRTAGGGPMAIGCVDFRLQWVLREYHIVEVQ